MKSKYVFILAIAAMFFQCDGQNKIGGSTGIDLKNNADSVGYAFGYNIGEYLKAQGVKNLTEEVNVEMVVKAMKLSIDNGKSPLTREQCVLTLNAFSENMRKGIVDKNKAEGAKFMEENKKKPGVITLPSGLQYQVITMGTGPKPTAADQVQVHYHGSLLNGEVFDSSVNRGQPITHSASGFIAGWNEALLMMPTGSKWKLWVPSDLAYGDAGAGPTIPPGSTLQFDIELLKVNP